MNKPSILSQQDLLGFGRDNRMWLNLEISKLFITVILPSKVKLLGVQILISCLISLIFLKIQLLCLTWPGHQIIILNDSNFWVQSNFISGQTIILLSLQAPICILFIYSMFILRPETRLKLLSCFKHANTDSSLGCISR